MWKETSIHLRTKVINNTKPVLGDIVEGKSFKNIPFLDEIDEMRKYVNTLIASFGTVKYVYPLGNMVNGGINPIPFADAILLTPDTVIENESKLNGIIDNLNTDWAVSVIELLSSIYSNVELIRVWTHSPFDFKVIVHCENRLNSKQYKLNRIVTNKKNISKVYSFMKHILMWISLIGVLSSANKDHPIIVEYVERLTTILDTNM